MQEYDMIRFLPSTIARAAVNAASTTLGWPPMSASDDGADIEKNVSKCTERIRAIAARAPTANLCAVYRRYAKLIN